LKKLLFMSVDLKGFATTNPLDSWLLFGESDGWPEILADNHTEPWSGDTANRSFRGFLFHFDGNLAVFPPHSKILFVLITNFLPA
jgi:hypothetical protein